MGTNDYFAATFTSPDLVIRKLKNLKLQVIVNKWSLSYRKLVN